MSQVKNSTCAEHSRSIFEGWVETTLGEVIKIIGGGTPKTSVSEYWNGEIPWLSVVDFNDDNRWVNSTEKTITSLGLEKSSTKLLNEGDIIISARGTVGAMAQLKREMTFNQSCYGIRNIENISEIDFIFYLLKISLKQINQNTYGAVFDTITTKTFDYINVKLPPLPEQKAIAKVLTAFDDKIENLLTQNETLEQTAQTIFTEWFGNYQIGDELPEGWRFIKVKNLDVVVTDFVANGSFASLAQNVTYKQDSDYAKLIRLTDYNRNFLGDFVYVDENAYNFLKKSKLSAGDIIISNVGAYAGTTFKCPDLDHAMTLGPNSIVLKSNFNNYFYLLFTSRIGKHLLSSIISGSAQPKFNKTAFRNLELLYNEEIVVEFEIMIKGLMSKINHNKKQIQLLSETRDTLLPKLMSGQLRVKGFKN